MTTQQEKNKTINYVIDATNVCNWHVANKGIRTSNKNEHNSNVSLDTLLKLVNMLIDADRTFQCIFDANTSYNLPEEEKYIYTSLLSEYKDFFYQVTGGIKADSFVLSIAAKYSSRVISNDNFSDYQGMYPWVKRDANPQRLFKGGIPMIASVKNLVLPELSLNAAIEETAEVLFNDLRRKLGYGNVRYKGQIQEFDKQKGVGGISIENGEDVYFNRSQLNLEIGDKVEFFIKINDDKKTYASDIHLQREEKSLGPRVWPYNEIFEGTIDWFDDKKGYGAIAENEGNKDKTLFFFLAGFEEGLKPEPDMEVVYEKKVNKRGTYGTNIKVGKATDFIMLKEYMKDLGKNNVVADTKVDAMKAEIESLKSIRSQYQQLLKTNNDQFYGGVVKSATDDGGIIKLDNCTLEVPFEYKKLKLRKKSLKENQIIQVKMGYSSKGIYVKFINMKVSGDTQKSSSDKTSKASQGTKARSTPVEPNKPESLTNTKAKLSNNGKQGNVKNKTQNKEQNQKKDTTKEQVKSKEQKQNKEQTKEKTKNNKEQHKGQKKSRNDEKVAVIKEQQPQQKKPVKEVGNNGKSLKSSEPKTSKKGEVQNKKVQVEKKPVPKTQAQKNNGNTNPAQSFNYADKAGNNNKLVYWGKNKENEIFLVANRLRVKDAEIDVWTFKNEDVKPEFLKKVYQSTGKIDTRIFPKKREHTIKPFNAKNLVPENFKLSSVTRKFIQKISDQWNLNSNQLDNYELLKKEITKIYKNIGKLKYKDEKINNTAVKLGDSIVQMVQEKKLTEEQSIVLRKGINQCLEKLHTLPKDKKK